MNAGRRFHLKLTSNLGDGGCFLVRLDIPPNEFKNSSLLSCYGHLTSSPRCLLQKIIFVDKRKFSEHSRTCQARRQVVFYRTGAVAWGRPLQPRFWRRAVTLAR